MKKLLPPYLFVLSILGICGVSIFAPSYLIVSYPWNLSGGLLLLVGSILLIVSSQLFSKFQTNIKTFNDPDKLVTNGPFKYSRNPMYLGFAICLFGVFILVGELGGLLFVALFVVITNLWYIPFEEDKMRQIFGQDYIEYKKRTRRWL